MSRLHGVALRLVERYKDQPGTTLLTSSEKIVVLFHATLDFEAVKAFYAQ